MILASGGTVEAREQEFIETIAAGIAHEVRNPLNAILLNIRILEQELSVLLPDRRLHVFETIAKLSSELDSLEKFVREFLRFARPPAIQAELLPVRPLLLDLVSFFRAQCDRKGVSLTCDLSTAPPSIVADGFQLKHALLNLLLNALQATPEGREISVETSTDDERFVVRIRDEGDGISAENALRIWDVFFTTREGGTGLGLPIAKRIVEAHGGALAIESTPGFGTIATVAIPMRGAG